MSYTSDKSAISTVLPTSGINSEFATIEDRTAANQIPISRPGARKRAYALERLRADNFIGFQLLVLTFSTGIQDAVSFPDFLCFASNQTGNTVFLAVGLTGFRAEFFSMSNVAVSLTMFLSGAVITGQLGNHLGACRRLWQILSNLAQTLMVLGAAWLQFVYGSNGQGPWTLGIITLLAFSSGSQVAAARAFRMTEISTAMATAAWVDLVIDERLLLARNRPRDRRALFLVTLVAGSFIGAYMRSKLGSPLTLVLSAVIKGMVIPMLLMTQADQPQQENDNSNGHI